MAGSTKKTTKSSEKKHTTRRSKIGFHSYVHNVHEKGQRVGAEKDTGAHINLALGSFASDLVIKIGEEAFRLVRVGKTKTISEHSIKSAWKILYHDDAKMTKLKEHLSTIDYDAFPKALIERTLRDFCGHCNIGSKAVDLLVKIVSNACAKVYNQARDVMYNEKVLTLRASHLDRALAESELFHDLATRKNYTVTDHKTKKGVKGGNELVVEGGNELMVEGGNDLVVEGGDADMLVSGGGSKKRKHSSSKSKSGSNKRRRGSNKSKRNIRH